MIMHLFVSTMFCLSSKGTYLPGEFHECSWVFWSRHCGARRAEERRKRISQIHLSNNSKLVLYADDILLYNTISEACDFSCLQEDVNRIDFWSSSNPMTFNVSKCKQMLLSRKRNPTTPTPMLLNGEPLEVVNSYKYLGFVIPLTLAGVLTLIIFAARLRKCWVC